MCIRDRFYLVPILYGVVVFLWVAGFDIIYALQDEAFDQKHKLNSVPSIIGQKRARFLSLAIHVIASLLLLLSTYLASTAYPTLGFLHWIGSAIFVILIFYQHLVIKRGGLEKIGLAFFTTNGLASLLFGVLFILDITWL